jgi:hypothetical protein
VHQSRRSRPRPCCTVLCSTAGLPAASDCPTGSSRRCVLAGWEEGSQATHKGVQALHSALGATLTWFVFLVIGCTTSVWLKQDAEQCRAAAKPTTILGNDARCVCVCVPAKRWVVEALGSVSLLHAVEEASCGSSACSSPSSQKQEGHRDMAQSQPRIQLPRE